MTGNSPYPAAMVRLMEMLQGIPGIGKRSAERMALQIYKWDEARQSALGELLCTFREKIGICPECGGMSEGPGERCRICSDSGRDSGIICVVEEFTQIRTIEGSGVFRGKYHVLGGRIAPLEGKMAEDLAIPLLLNRIQIGGISEIILALSPDVEGQATGIYLADLLKDTGIPVTRLAQGLPAGADLSYADSATMALALNRRTPF